MSSVDEVGGGGEEEAAALDVEGGQPQGFISLLLSQLHLRPNLPRKLEVFHVDDGCGGGMEELQYLKRVRVFVIIFKLGFSKLSNEISS